MSASVGLTKILRSQRGASLLAFGMVVAALWISVPMGEWRVGGFLAIGFVLSLVNHLLTELTLMRSVGSGGLLTRKQFAMTSLVRLMGISLVGVTLAAVFWPEGAAVLVGLALFHMVTLVLTGLPLLKEIKKA